ncbi:MAG: hypothetical protein AAF745_12290, partial [Planctomycetota bacterium]
MDGQFPTVAMSLKQSASTEGRYSANWGGNHKRTPGNSPWSVLGIGRRMAPVTPNQGRKRIGRTCMDRMEIVRMASHQISKVFRFPHSSSMALLG